MIDRVKGIASLIVLGAMIAAGFYIQHLRERSAALDDTRTALALLESQHAAFVAQVEADKQERDHASQTYQAELVALRDDLRNLPVPVVRVCNIPTPAVPVPAREGAAPGSGTATAPAAVVQPGTAPDTGRDIGPALDAFAREADRITAQCRAALSYLQ